MDGIEKDLDLGSQVFGPLFVQGKAVFDLHPRDGRDGNRVGRKREHLRNNLRLPSDEITDDAGVEQIGHSRGFGGGRHGNGSSERGASSRRDRSKGSKSFAAPANSRTAL